MNKWEPHRRCEFRVEAELPAGESRFDWMIDLRDRVELADLWVVTDGPPVCPLAPGTRLRELFSRWQSFRPELNNGWGADSRQFRFEVIDPTQSPWLYASVTVDWPGDGQAQPPRGSTWPDGIKPMDPETA